MHHSNFNLYIHFNRETRNIETLSHDWTMDFDWSRVACCINGQKPFENKLDQKQSKDIGLEEMLLRLEEM